MFAGSRQRSTWVGLQLKVPLQGEDQGAGSRAKYLPRSKVHAIIYLEVKAARQCTCTRTEWKKIIKTDGFVSNSLIYTWQERRKTFAHHCAQTTAVQFGCDSA